jgi:hypothetical protein
VNIVTWGCAHLRSSLLLPLGDWAGSGEWAKKGVRERGTSTGLGRQKLHVNLAAHLGSPQQANLFLHREVDFYFPKFSISGTSRLEMFLPQVNVGGDFPRQLGLNVSKVSLG